MRLKSRGLGRKELVMDFREYSVIRENGETVDEKLFNDTVDVAVANAVPPETGRDCERSTPRRSFTRIAVRFSVTWATRGQ